jgi:hypothetical protein
MSPIELVSTRTGWRSVVDDQNPRAFARWVRDTRGFCGVYLIRAAGTGFVGGAPAQQGEILYVGESHSHELYATLTRHFQNGLGPTNHYYERERVEARIQLLNAEEAIPEQDRQILRHTPRDNTRLPF